jgi:oxygen-independent coproporphyrinogen-3 oxidase
MDHFAVPEDELAVAQTEGRLHRNFMGYTVMPAADQIGMGISSIGDVRGAFAQNVKKLSTYYAALDEGRLPIERGYVRDRDDEIRRYVIGRLMCNFTLSMEDVERRFGIVFRDYFARELSDLSDVVDSGILALGPERIEVTQRGRIFVRIVCMVFDRYLRTKNDPDKPMFSRTV